MRSDAISVRPLGQSGFRFEAAGHVLYTDPYLSDSVATREGAHLRRMVPISTPPGSIHDAEWILVSHEHLDHCDDATILPMLAASPRARVFGPAPVLKILRARGVPADRLQLASDTPLEIGDGVRVTPVPAAHTAIERDADRHLRFLGFVLSVGAKNVYFAGDTSPHPEIVAAVKRVGKLHAAFLPVNERNHYKERDGIVGNMSAREAFLFAQELGASIVVPMHHDMFAGNSVLPEEIEILYEHQKPPFELRFAPEAI